MPSPVDVQAIPNAQPTGPRYRGRFAPTPSGPLHLGSLLTALASFIEARKSNGIWLLRIDDLDRQRASPEHAATIQHQLEDHGLYWDEAVRWQTRHVEEYEAALQSLAPTKSLYRCTCTRARLASESHEGPDGAVYAGRCRSTRDVLEQGAIRIAVGEGRIPLDDPWQPDIVRDLAREVGDFVLRRADGQIGYQLACVVDDIALGITDVVRGADLIGSSLRQSWLMHRVGHEPPRYRHLPVILDQQGNKLSKQNHAAPLDGTEAAGNLKQCLNLLRQPSPDTNKIEEILGSAINSWNPALVPKSRVIAAPT